MALTNRLSCRKSPIFFHWSDRGHCQGFLLLLCGLASHSSSFSSFLHGITLWEMAPCWRIVVFEKAVSSHSNNETHQLKPFVTRPMKALKFVFFFCYSFATLMTNCAQIFTELLFYGYVRIHQVRILIFNNYQMYPVPLTYCCLYYVLVQSLFLGGLRFCFCNWGRWDGREQVLIRIWNCLIVSSASNFHTR